MAITTFPIELKQTKTLTPSVRHFAFLRADGTPFHFIPGQFFNIYFEHQGKTLNRSYSIASIPSQTDYLEMAAAYVEGGPASELLFSLEPGAQLTAAGPFGRLILPAEHPQRYILMATSTGVTPYRAMLAPLQKILEENTSVEVLVMLGVKTRSDLLYADDFLTFAKQQPRFHFRAHYSRETTSDLQPWEHLGYIQLALPELKTDPTRDLVYLCGNPNMIDDAFTQLQTSGFATSQIKREKYFSRK